MCVARHDGELPTGLEELRSLPGVGEYTAAAVASFAFGQRHAVLDTNVRRVLSRIVGGTESVGNLTMAERRRAEALLPHEAATWNVAVMELGALVCTARAPRCGTCPVSAQCGWLAAGRPAGTPRRGQTYAGTDRQVRGRLLSVLRDATGPVTDDVIATAWEEPVQRLRALDGLVTDGLVEPQPDGTWALPT
jgi:A/G-specific adenine glycosylase